MLFDSGVVIDMMRLDSKVAVVTGGASGNGRAITRKLASHGADVVVADIQREPREGGVPTDELITSSTDAHALFVECDVTNQSDLEAAADAAEEHGGLDIMVNNAGIVVNEDFTEITESAFDRIMNVNVKGTFLGSQVAIRRMVDGDGGSIVNMSSTSGILGSNTSVSYSASKGAVTLLTYSLAAQYGGEGIRSNVIHPGITETEMMTSDVGVDFDDKEAMADILHKIPDGRLAKPEDIAHATVFLASDYADHINGESLVVDGGQVNSDTPAGWTR